ncbi:hypothetical protein JTE90_003016 [Oedothorax gibbosus]|uniref:Uncharacterized protein n=1 Tax=Oedothorax gibbosus TaxID=931172 RepID=A0AAV6VED6_9ARAC|nr:hypothetical protein JTE90_003016 [Oedothorax gibbosus]
MQFLGTSSKHFYAVFLYFLVLVNSVYTTKRRLNCTVYPKHETYTEALNLAHITSVGDMDTVHYLWSTYKVPSVVVARTTNEAVLHVDYEKFKAMERGALDFGEEPLAYTGLTISELFEKSYSSDTSSIDKPSSEIALGLDLFKWNSISNVSFNCNDLFASLQLDSSSKEDDVLFESGLFRMQFSASAEVQDAADYPHLVYTGNSSQVKVSFDGFHTLLNSSRTRYGMEVMVFSNPWKNCSDTECKAEVEDAISDEFSPGVFSDVNLVTPCSLKGNENGTFISWRPVAYTSKEPTVANSSDANMGKSCPRISVGTAHSIAELFFEDLGVSSNVFNMTFGTEGAGFYSKTLYTEWTLMLGTGTAVHSKLSIAAIVFLSVGGLGLSVLVGSIFLVVRYFQRKQDDDLLLVN